jgi:ABC-2 type transport system ATP-binding protein
MCETEGKTKRFLSMLLELDKFTVRYGRHEALNEVSVSLDSKALGILGPNGAGKSTLIRALLGLVPVNGGEAHFDDLDVRREGKRIREMIGYMPEHESYLPGMTAIRFLRFMGEMCGLPAAAAMERAHEVLFYVGLGEVRYRPVDGLSYGLHQKVRLAQALIHGPKILILDEPTNGLDPTARDEMLGLIRDMISHSESKVVMCSHLLKDIETCCEEALVLKKGRVVAAGNIEAMKQTCPNVFEMRIKGNLDRFMAALSELGCECRLGERDALQVTVRDGVTPQAFFEIARNQGTQIRHFYAKKDTLEDVFLKAIEDEIPPSAPNGEAKDAYARL